MDIAKRKAQLFQENDNFCATNTVFAAARDRHIDLIVEQEVLVEQLQGEILDMQNKLDDQNACTGAVHCGCKDCRLSRLSNIVTELRREKCDLKAEINALDLKVLQLEEDAQKNEGCYNDDGCTCQDCIIAGHMETIQHLKLQICGLQRERDSHTEAINQQTTRYEELLVKYNKMHEMLENIHGVFGADWEEFAT